MIQQIQERLAALRRSLAAAGADAVIIPQTDPHQSEYIADHWQVREFFSGFTGSAGTLVVTADKALLWVDSRYFLQGAAQIAGTEIILMKECVDNTPTVEQWLCDNLHSGQCVAIDGMVFSATATEDLRKSLAARGIGLITDFDPTAGIWNGRPALPDCKAFVHDVKYAGQSAADKVAAILDNARRQGVRGIFISALDEIAWTLNLRSNDVTFNPVLTSFLYLSDRGSTLFVDPRKLTPEVSEYLASQGIATAPYSSVRDFLAALPEDTAVLVEPGRNTASLVDTLGARAVAGPSPVAVAKAVKNNVQLDGFRAAMARDGVALVRSFMEIERRAAGEGEPLTELGVCEILRRYRSQQPLFFDESFGTIAGYGPHGAIVHYEPEEESDVAVVTGNLLLVDSGAQYLDGTTDITRTICLGTPNDVQRRDFTLVMKGHIALARAVFPAGTTGTQLDVLARQFLWQAGLGYLHGTGHGIGHFLNVHEGPHRIALNYFATPLMAGMVTSNEPGLYREGVHGIRCENVVVTVPAMDTEFGHFLRFETITLFPFDLALFDKSLMTADEIQWVNDYHDHVREVLTPLLDTDEEREWLRARTARL